MLEKLILMSPYGVVDRREERSDVVISFSNVKTRLLRGETARKDSSTGFFNVLLSEQKEEHEQSDCLFAE